MPFDPAAQANALAVKFNDASQAVDDFRLNCDPPPNGDQMSRLKDESHALEDRAHYFTAEAIGATLQGIAPDLDKINAVTAQATAQLGNLNDVEKAISIATLTLTLGTAIAGGDPATILAAAQALALRLVPSSSTST